MEDSYNLKNAATFLKYRLHFNGQHNSNSRDADFNYDLLEVFWGEITNLGLRVIASEYLGVEPEPEPQPDCARNPTEFIAGYCKHPRFRDNTIE